MPFVLVIARYLASAFHSDGFLAASEDLTRDMFERLMRQGGESVGALLITLQAFQVLFLLCHDLVPLGQLNDIETMRSNESAKKLAVTTCVQTVPFAAGLYFSLLHYNQPPHWLFHWLIVMYAVLLGGELRAWWVPYLLIPDPVRAQRYKAMFGKTHTFLPKHNGMTPNTAHILLHLSTAATVVLLLAQH